MSDTVNSSPRRVHAPPLDDHNNLLSEILLRLPPHPACLLRASLVCRRWRRLLRDPAFLRRARAFHRTPPVLGLYRIYPTGSCAFVPFGEAPDRVSAARFAPRDPNDWTLLGCRHGRTLLRSRPPAGSSSSSGTPSRTTAAASASAGSGATSRRAMPPFLATGVDWAAARGPPSAWLSCSQAAEARCEHVDTRPVAFVGNALYWLLHDGRILELPLGKESLAVVEPPPHVQSLYQKNIQLIEAEDDVLGFAGLKECSLQL